VQIRRAKPAIDAEIIALQGLSAACGYGIVLAVAFYAVLQRNAS
jgi:hypothetical protein